MTVRRALVLQLWIGAAWLSAVIALPFLLWPRAFGRFDAAGLGLLFGLPLAGWLLSTLLSFPVLRAAWTGPRWRVVVVAATLVGMAGAGAAYGVWRPVAVGELVGLAILLGLPLAVVLLWVHTFARGEASLWVRRA